MTSTAETAAVIKGLGTLPDVLADLRERVNSLPGEQTVDALAVAAGNEARAAVLGLRADVADGAVPETEAVTVFFVSIGEIELVDWPVVGEAILMDVVGGNVR